MGKSQRKIKLKPILILMIFIILFILSFYITYNNYSKYSKVNSSKNSLNKELVKIKKEYNELNKTKQDLEKSINEANSLEEKIESTKKEVFELAKQVEEKIKNNETDKKIAYLTFDDGPYYKTDSVLAILKEHKVKATFFTIGAGKDTCFDKKSVSCKETYKRIVDNNHTIANHTYSHSIFNGLYSSADSFMEQVQKQEDLILERTGVTTNILRFPGGSRTAGRLKDDISEKLREKNYGWVDWTAEDGDGRDLESKERAWNILKSSIDEDIEVILMHDYNEITYSILPDVIEYLEEKGYILLPLFYDSVMVNK